MGLSKRRYNPFLLDVPRLLYREVYSFQWLRDSLLQPLRKHLSSMPTHGGIPNDDYCGMASIPFPSLRRDNSIDIGL
jgi:hypothetical protein